MPHASLAPCFLLVLVLLTALLGGAVAPLGAKTLQCNAQGACISIAPDHPTERDTIVLTIRAGEAVSPGHCLAAGAEVLRDEAGLHVIVNYRSGDPFEGDCFGGGNGDTPLPAPDVEQKIEPLPAGTYPIDARLRVLTVAVVDSVALVTGVLDVGAAEAPQPPNYGGLWWNAPAGSESGWGLNIAHQGDIAFATWFTYDRSGQPSWLSMIASRTDVGTFAGVLYRTSGPAFSAAPFDPRQVRSTAVGSATLRFPDENNGTFEYSVDGVAQTKNITRQVFTALPHCTFGAEASLVNATNYQDLWWTDPPGSESGWGINVTHQGSTIFATWFTYDEDGNPLWLSATADRVGTNSYFGRLYRTTGPAFDSVPFDPARVVATDVGLLSLAFRNGNDATFAYAVDGVMGVKTITREVFKGKGTVCQ